MRALDLVRRSAVAVPPDETVTAAAALMEAAGVGALAVVDADHALLGIVTDRDLVRRAMARRLPPDSRIDGVMTAPVLTIEADADAHDAYGMFHRHAVRRLPVVERGRFVGMLSVDDLLMNLSAELADLVRPITAEVVFGHHEAAHPAKMPPG